MAKKPLSPQIFFRADGNTQIGLGHITRCLALADMLRQEFDCVFLVQNPTAAVKAQIEADFKLFALPQTEDFLREAHFLATEVLTTGQTIVLDHYQIQTEYQKILKTAGLKVVCIDDMHAWHFVADVVINHAGGVSEKDYSCEPHTKLYLGLEYALLRRPFLEVAQKLAAQGGRKIEKIENVLICFGGSDIHNLSQQAAEACLKNPQFKEIHVVLGSAFSFLEDFTNFAQAHHRLHLHQNLNAQEMCDLMLHCHLAIVPASGIAYEVLATRMYMITGWYAENQKAMYRFLSKNKLGWGIGNFENIDNANLSFDLTTQFSTYPKTYLESTITKKFKSVFYGLMMHIRKANIEDMKLYFDWANDIEVRQNSIHTEPIVWENHQRWFLNKLQSEHTRLYVFEIQSNPIGQLRIDFQENIGLINYALDTRYRGLGLGKLMVQKTMKELKMEGRTIKLKAQVKQTNIASLKVFEQLGFALENQENGLLTFFK
ncbi:MAG: UDP-2,4-diacetamido-2,4,6-trideoxy-beta-L-altropyranose hydrolase [Bernardetiaceae bacterium]|nr:UDP-2,4-diacetamido-2,4,6-trideoxy-beta-L-altropyranose hydrolase [Bernardetiaceae bacterium]